MKMKEQGEGKMKKIASRTGQNALNCTCIKKNESLMWGGGVVE